MVLIKNRVKRAILPLAVTSLIFIDGCKEDEINPGYSTDLLVGNWGMIEWDEYDYTNNDWYINWKFEQSGDMEFCLGYENTEYHACYNLKWKWFDADQSSFWMINETDPNDINKIKVDIDLLNESKLEGIGIYDTYEDTVSFKFIKVQ